MLNHYPLWKNALLAFALLIGAIYAAPNLFGEDPALQISASGSGEITEQLAARVEGTLISNDIGVKQVELSGQRLLIRLDSEKKQQLAGDIVRSALDANDYVVALNLAPRTPDWLSSMGAAPMYLGLDLRGGVHFLMEVDREAVLARAYSDHEPTLKKLLRKSDTTRFKRMFVEKDHILITFKTEPLRDAAYEKLRSNVNELLFSDVDGERPALKATLTDAYSAEKLAFALEQNITTLRSRVNELGVAEPVIQRQGDNRVVVQLPGVQDTARAKQILGATATLDFRHVVRTPSEAATAAATKNIPPGSRLYVNREEIPFLLSAQPIVTGERITNASSGMDSESASPAVFVTLDGEGADMMSRATRDRIGKQMAVVFKETKTRLVKMPDGSFETQKYQHERVINNATIQAHLSKKFQITGLDSLREANDLALLLRAGSLSAPMDIIEERTIGPSLGADNIEQGQMSVMIGLALVLVFMAIYYRLFGLVANIALVVNLVFIVAILSILQATLTMPGIAGIVLTVGMAVDANVLIFERIREEVRNGNSPQASIHAGYEKAFSTIADANVTTLIAAIVLFGLGSGPVKGFAVTLTIGILTSMFTAILGTRAIVNLIYGGKRIQKLAI